ncbi:MAG: hypothetical protein ABIH36_04475 [bacterium]
MEHKNFQALCDLSDTKTRLNPDQLARLIHEAPDPETATQAVFANFTSCSDALSRAWRQLVSDLWSAHHPHIPVLLNLPLTTNDVSDVSAVQDATTFLGLVADNPPTLVHEGKEWLLASTDAYNLARSLPSLRSLPIIQLENEWQYLSLRRLRDVLQILKLVRRVKDKLVPVKSRYQRFISLPAIHQFYLLWHTEAYHIDWAQFAGIWGEYLRVIQEFLPLLWDLSKDAAADIPRDIREWNQDVWEAFSPLWEQEGLLERPSGRTALFSLVRVQSLPTALTQVILRDLLERYNLIVGEGDLYAWSTLGVKLTAAERTQELPCALELIK